MPDSDPEDVPLDPSEDAAMGNGAPTKRRAAHTPPSQPANPNITTPPLKAIPPSIFSRPGRRRRLFLYVTAFAIMLALSSMLDLRRAALNARRAEKVHLALPSAAAPALDEESSAVAPNLPANGAAVAEAITAAANSRKSQASSPPSSKLPAASASNAERPQSVSTVPQDVAKRPPGQETHLSLQELKDDVDQLIAHVDQESSTAAATSAVNGTTPATTSATSTEQSGSRASPASSANSPTAESVPGSNPSSSFARADHGTPDTTSGGSQTAVATNATAADDENRPTSDDLFVAAQSKIDSLMKNETMKPYLDVNELRTLHALALQGTRGDCLQATDPRSGGSLFKTDAEAASADIEKTDPLWGAWCLFSGWYKSDAMREYVLRSRAFHRRVHARFAAAAAISATKGRADGPGNTNANGATASDGADHAIMQSKAFDQNAASLDDVLTPEEQTALRSKVKFVLPHLQEGAARNLAALSLQATFGDCGPYAEKHPGPGSDGGLTAAGTAVDAADDDATRLRPLTEPLLGRTATRGEGALWGAWCVFMGRKRPLATSQLTERVESLLKQLSQKLSPSANTPVTHAVSRTAPVGGASFEVEAGAVRER